jgi:hypothetical protein
MVAPWGDLRQRGVLVVPQLLEVHVSNDFALVGEAYRTCILVHSLQLGLLSVASRANDC